MALPLPSDQSKPGHYVDRDGRPMRYWQECPFCGRLVYDAQPFKVSICTMWLGDQGGHQVIYKVGKK